MNADLKPFSPKEELVAQTIDQAEERGWTPRTAVRSLQKHAKRQNIPIIEKDEKDLVLRLRFLCILREAIVELDAETLKDLLSKFVDRGVFTKVVDTMSLYAIDYLTECPDEKSVKREFENKLRTVLQEMLSSPENQDITIEEEIWPSVTLLFKLVIAKNLGVTSSQ